MKICPVCQESSHDAADRCVVCGAALGEQASGGASREVAPARREASPPSPGTWALALYEDAQPRVVGYLPILGEVALLGREDAGGGVFPELDLAPWAGQGASVERASRRHAWVLRRGEGWWLQVLPGTTGTQVNQARVEEGREVPLQLGDRVILGGRVRLKLVRGGA